MLTPSAGAHSACPLQFSFWLTLLLCPGIAYAHPTPSSYAYLDFTLDGARLEQYVPIEELERALKTPLQASHNEPAEHTVARHQALLARYAAQHLNASSATSGAPWQVAVQEVVGFPYKDGPRALFRFALTAPPGEAAASLVLNDDLVAHEVVTHYTLVYVKSDWAAGRLGRRARLISTLRHGRTQANVAREGSFWQGFCSVLTLGAQHIAAGTDHLMFLFALVLVAPLTAKKQRWHGRRRPLSTLGVLAKLVSAFTIGHSLTLAIGVLGGLTLPKHWVEIGVAVSILITALHAAVPLFPRHESTLACFFGLIHGLAFASEIPIADLGRTQAAWTLIGFNLGIELAQLALLSAVLPPLLVLARTRFYSSLRLAGAATAGALACGWLAERTLTVANPFERSLSFLTTHPLLPFGALVVIALVAWAAERRLPQDESAQDLPRT